MRCARCDWPVYDDKTADCRDVADLRSGEIEEPAAFTEEGEPLCVDCAEKLSIQPEEGP